MIIGISGVAGSGKSTTANVLVARGFARGKFAAALKAMLRTLLAYRRVPSDEIERMIEGDLKELPHLALNGKSPRHAMQTLGAWGRNELEEDFWVDVEFDALEDEPKILFEDLRHDNEEAAIVRRGGVVAHLTGRGGIDGTHFSESFKPKVATVIDNSGTVEELQAKVNQFADDLSWAE